MVIEGTLVLFTILKIMLICFPSSLIICCGNLQMPFLRINKVSYNPRQLRLDVYKQSWFRVFKQTQETPTSSMSICRIPGQLSYSQYGESRNLLFTLWQRPHSPGISLRSIFASQAPKQHQHIKVSFPHTLFHSLLTFYITKFFLVSILHSNLLLVKELG